MIAAVTAIIRAPVDGQWKRELQVVTLSVFYTFVFLSYSRRSDNWQQHADDSNNTSSAASHHHHGCSKLDIVGGRR